MKLFRITPLRMVAVGIALALFSGPVLGASIGLGMFLLGIGAVVRHELRLRNLGVQQTLLRRQQEGRRRLLMELGRVNDAHLSPSRAHTLKVEVWRRHVRQMRQLRGLRTRTPVRRLKRKP